MRSFIFWTFLFACLLISAGCQQIGKTAENPVSKVSSPNQTAASSVGPEAQTGKLDDKTREALLAALSDERRAQAVYEAVVEKFGDVRPFSNIVNAEKRHESFLLPLFEKYGVEVPKNEFGKDEVQVPATVAEACQNAVGGEKANIAMYERFLEFVKETDIRDIFTYLRDASKNNHLPAFERCGGGGRGRN